METTFWRKCSACKKPIGFKEAYQRCNVTTCNQGRTSLVFCSVPCWATHVPVVRHKNAWALEETSPSAEEWAKQSAGEAPRTAVLVRPAGATSSERVSNAPSEASAVSINLAPANTDEILVVASKLKAYIRERSEMNTSGDVLEALSDKLRQLCDAAIGRARADGRKTVMARDF